MKLDVDLLNNNTNFIMKVLNKIDIKIEEIEKKNNTNKSYIHTI